MFEFITATLAVCVMTFAGLNAAPPQYDPSIHAYTQDYGSNTVVVEGHGWQPLTWISIHAKNTDTYVRSSSKGIFETSLTLDTQRSNSEVKITASAGEITRRLSVIIIGDDRPPTITLQPSVVGIRDYVTISGTGWDVRNHPRIVATFTVDDIETSLVENLNEFGGFSSEFRVTPWAAAPGLINVSVTDGNHSVHATVRIIAPSIEMLDERAHAGDNLSFFATDLSVYAEVFVEIDAVRVDLPYMTTDRDGSVEFTLPAALEPGAHVIKVTTNIGPMNHAGTAFYVHEE
jgi:hypothetical protein